MICCGCGVEMPEGRRSFYCTACKRRYSAEFDGYRRLWLGMRAEPRRRTRKFYKGAISRDTGLEGAELGKAVGYALLARDLAKLSPDFLRQLYAVA